MTKIIPIVRSLCPEHMLAHEFQMCTHNQVLNPLREMQSLFGTPHKLIQKWRDKYSDSIRLYQSNPEIAMQAKQIFSALNAQLMAELPKVSTESRLRLYLGLVRLKFDVRVKVQNYRSDRKYPIFIRLRNLIFQISVILTDFWCNQVDWIYNWYF